MEKFIVMSLEDENSKQLAKVLSNSTALKIMNKLAEKRFSPSELAKELNLPISTVQYNLDLLKQANMIKETAYRYSEKGKKVSYYEPVKKLIIIAPENEKNSIVDILKDKFWIFAAVVITIIIGYAIQPFFEVQQEVEAKALLTSRAPITCPSPFVIFVLGGIVALITMVLLIYLKRKIGGN